MSLTFFWGSDTPYLFNGPVGGNPSTWSSGAGTVDDVNPHTGKYSCITGLGENLNIDPPWSDTGERYWWVFFSVQWEGTTAQADPNAAQLATCLLATTPDPQNDDGGSDYWLKVYIPHIDPGTDDGLDSINVVVGNDDLASSCVGATTLATYDCTGDPEAQFWVGIRFDKGDGGANNPGAELYINGNLEDSGTDATLTRVMMNFAYGGGAVLDDPKAGPMENQEYIDSMIVLDEDSSGSYDGEIESGDFDIGHYQTTNDVTGYDEWSPSAGIRCYAKIDDFNSNTEILDSEPDDYIQVAADDKKQLCALADEPNGAATIDAVMICIEKRTAGGGVNILAGCSDEGAGPVEYVPGVGTCWYEVAAYITLFLTLTPGSNAWSRAKLNALYVGVQSSDASNRQVRVVGVQAIGTNLDDGAENTSDVNADVADPWAVAVTHIRQGMALGSANAMMF